MTVVSGSRDWWDSQQGPHSGASRNNNVVEECFAIVFSLRVEAEDDCDKEDCGEFPGCRYNRKEYKFIDCQYSAVDE